jgi:predicted secreted protein
MSRLVIPLFLLAACAGSQEPSTTTTRSPSTAAPAAAEPQEDQEVCHEEASTGSLVKRTVCRSQSQIEQDRRNADDMHRKANQAPPPSNSRD